MTDGQQAFFGDYIGTAYLVARESGARCLSNRKNSKRYTGHVRTRMAYSPELIHKLQRSTPRIHFHAPYSHFAIGQLPLRTLFKILQAAAASLFGVSSNTAIRWCMLLQCQTKNKSNIRPKRRKLSKNPAAVQFVPDYANHPLPGPSTSRKLAVGTAKEDSRTSFSWLFFLQTEQNA